MRATTTFFQSRGRGLVSVVPAKADEAEPSSRPCLDLYLCVDSSVESTAAADKVKLLLATVAAVIRRLDARTCPDSSTVASRSGT